MSTKVPSFDQLLWPTMLALKANGGSATIQEILEKVVEIGNIPESVQAVAQKGHRNSKLEYNLAWARTYLRRAGLVENPTPGKGVWTITDAGESASESFVKTIAERDKREQAERRKKSSQPKKTQDVDVIRIGDAEEWQDSLLQVLTTIPPDAFERLAQRLLRESGFVKVHVTGRSGDGGIDGLGVLRFNLLSFQVSFQCKRYKGSVGPSAIRDFRGAMVGRGDKGLFITTGTFTSSARQEATRDGAPAIDLIDGSQLCELLQERNLGVHTEMVPQVSIDKSWFEKI